MVIKRIFRILFFIVPFILGFIAYLSLPYKGMLAAAYSAVRLYFMSVDTYEITPLLELARWWAFFVVACSVAWVAARAAGTHLLHFFKCFHPKSCAVYGDSAAVKYLLNSMGWRAIAAGSKVIPRARRHLLVFDNDDVNLDFYAKHREVFAKKTTTLVLDNIAAECIQDENVQIFTAAKHCATSYWIDNPIKSTRGKIAIIGFGAVGQAVLEAGLLLNIRSAQQQIEYHVWGSFEQYKGLHPHLTNEGGVVQGGTKDRIKYHDEHWKCGLIHEEDVSRVIFCGTPAENLQSLSCALELLCFEKMHIYMDCNNRIQSFDRVGNIVSFGMTETLYTEKNVFYDALMDDAKELHGRYLRTNANANNVPWADLSTFHKRSNIAAANYKHVLKELKESDPHMEWDKLAELEHIRWCRFHYMHNYQYGERDVIKRMHPKLVAYSKLPEDDKEKCRQSVFM